MPKMSRVETYATHLLGSKDHIWKMMNKYQYKIVDTRDVESAGLFKGRKRQDIEAYLNSLGTDGWELVNVDFRELEGGLEFAGLMKKEV